MPTITHVITEDDPINREWTISVEYRYHRGYRGCSPLHYLGPTQDEPPHIEIDSWSLVSCHDYSFGDVPVEVTFDNIKAVEAWLQPKFDAAESAIVEACWQDWNGHEEFCLEQHYERMREQ